MEKLDNVGKMKNVKTKLGFEGIFAIPKSDNYRGLAMLWYKEDFATIIRHSLWHIDLEVRLPGEQPYRVMRLYRWPNRTHRA